MSEEPAPITEAPTPKQWYRRELVIFIVASVLIAFSLVVISMALYTSSGASLLDLSRPGYKSVQSEVVNPDSFEAFSASGAVTKSTLDQFQQIYDKQVKSVSNSIGYNDIPLSDQALGIEDPATDQ